MFGLFLEFFSCSSTPTVLKKSRSSQRHQGTYMITFNPAARSCLPKPIVNLWWKLWLPLKFASHFIFWRPWQSSFTYSCVSVKRAVNDETVASLSRQVSQQLSTRHALSTDFMEGGLWIWWDFPAGRVWFLSFFWSFSVLASISQRTYMHNSIQVYTVLSFNFLTIAAENLASIIIFICKPFSAD